MTREALARAIVIGGAAGALGLGAFAAGRHGSPAPASATPSSAPAAAEHAHAAPLPASQGDPRLAADLASPDPRIRRAAMSDAVRSNELGAPALVTATRDPDLEVAVTAAGALGRSFAGGRVSASEVLAITGDRSLPEKVRAAALGPLSQVPRPEVASALVAMLERGDVLERRSASAALVNHDRAVAIPALIEALTDSDEYVRGQALDSLHALARGRDFGTDAGAWRAWWQSVK